MSDLPPLTKAEDSLGRLHNVILELDAEIEGKRRNDRMAMLYMSIEALSMEAALDAVDQMCEKTGHAPISRNVEYYLLGRHRKP